MLFYLTFNGIFAGRSWQYFATGGSEREREQGGGLRGAGDVIVRFDTLERLRVVDR